MSFLDKIQSMIGGGDKEKVAEGNKKAKSNKTKGSKRLDVEARFERKRSAVSGTMSNFIAAYDREYDRVVGLKLCDPEKVQMFEGRFKGLKKPTEGEIAVRMKNEFVVETYEYGMTNKGQPYLVMEYVDGPGLLQMVNPDKDEQLRGKKLNLIREMAQAIRYVHDMNFIHRDICPRNFICKADLSGLKLIDFGLTVPQEPPFLLPGNRTGTPLYMAPEIVRRRHTDHRVDIFAFGVSCYTLCTYEFPWPSDDTTGKAALQHDTHPPKPILELKPDLDPTLAAAIMKCLEPIPDNRMPDMKTFLGQIARMPAGATV